MSTGAYVIPISPLLAMIQRSTLARCQASRVEAG